jgi:hypothetical protein
MAATGERSGVRFLEAHLGSRDVARVIYGAIIGLALVVALEKHPPSAGQIVTALVATAIAVGLAELYSEAIGEEAVSRRPVPRARLRAMAGDAGAVIFGASFPAAFFALAAADLIDLDLAFTLAKWTGVGLIGTYGYVAARLAGVSRTRSGMQALAVGAIGVLLIVVKAALH